MTAAERQRRRRARLTDVTKPAPVTKPEPVTKPGALVDVTKPERFRYAEDGRLVADPSGEPFVYDQRGGFVSGPPLPGATARTHADPEPVPGRHPTLRNATDMSPEDRQAFADRVKALLDEGRFRR